MALEIRNAPPTNDSFDRSTSTVLHTAVCVQYQSTMGRKKRKTSTEAVSIEADVSNENPLDPRRIKRVKMEEEVEEEEKDHDTAMDEDDDLFCEDSNPSKQEEDTKKPQSSSYAVTSHSGEIVPEDIYVSSGEESEDEIHFLLAGARMGLMRRGLHHNMLLQPNRQWSRKNNESVVMDSECPQETEEEERKRKEQELAALDPAERAARLLQDKLRKEQLEQQLARRKEAEENAGRDPLYFTKRTAFDIKLDQIEDKPWARQHGDGSDFFNYGLSEQEWVEYAAQQVVIRQELIDARQQSRPIDPAIVPVIPRTVKDDGEAEKEPGPSASGPDGEKDGEDRKKDDEERAADDKETDCDEENTKMKEDEDEDEAKRRSVDIPAVSAGGAWGAIPEHLLEQPSPRDPNHEHRWDRAEQDAQMDDANRPHDDYYGGGPPQHYTHPHPDDRFHHPQHFQGRGGYRGRGRGRGGFDPGYYHGGDGPGRGGFNINDRYGGPPPPQPAEEPYGGGGRGGWKRGWDGRRGRGRGR